MAEGGRATSLSKKHDLVSPDNEQSATKKSRHLSTEEKITVDVFDADMNTNVESGSDVEPDIDVRLGADDIHLQEGFKGFPETIKFPNDICAIIVGSSVKDAFIEFLNTTNTLRNREMHEKRIKNLLLSSRQEDNQTTSTEHTREITTETENQTPDEDLLTKFENSYKRIKISLNDTLRKFKTDDLRENTENTEDFQKFTKLRKELTFFYKSGQNVLHHINTYKTTRQINIISTKINTIPLPLNKKFQDTFTEKINKTTRIQNIQLLHELINQNLEKCMEIEDLFKDTNDFVIAKAFRTVTLSNKEISDGALRKKSEYNNRETNKRNLDEQEVHSEEEMTTRDRKHTNTKHTEDYGPRRFQPRYRYEQRQDYRSEPKYRRDYQSRRSYQDDYEYKRRYERHEPNREYYAKTTYPSRYVPREDDYEADSEYDEPRDRNRRRQTFYNGYRDKATRQPNLN